MDKVRAKIAVGAAGYKFACYNSVPTLDAVPKQDFVLDSSLHRCGDAFLIGVKTNRLAS